MVANIVDIWYIINMDYVRDGNRVHLILYHIVFCPKRRKAVLVGDVASRCKSIVEKVCQSQGWEIVALEVMPDHIHLFVRVWPTTPAHEVVKKVKGATSRCLRAEFPSLLRLPSLWTRSYGWRCLSGDHQEVY